MNVKHLLFIDAGKAVFQVPLAFTMAKKNEFMYTHVVLYLLNQFYFFNPNLS